MAGRAADGGRKVFILQGARAVRALAAALALACAGCASPPPPPPVGEVDPPPYRIAAGDTVQIFVWRAPDLSATVPVRPDGRISTPLVPDEVAAGKTSAELADALKTKLSAYMQDPVVTVVVTKFSDPVAQQVRVIGEVLRPVSVAWRPDLSVLDAIVDTGGLTQFAAGNRAVLVRHNASGVKNYTLRLDDLVRNGDISANAALKPGDEIIVPRSWF